MRIHLQLQGIDLTEAISGHVQRQINFNLANFKSHIQSVHLFMSDINGPKGGPDKRALVRIQLGSHNTVAIERVHADLYAAITLVSRQAKRAVKRALNRQQRMEKRALRDLRQYGQT